MQTENNSDKFAVIQYLNEEVVEGFFIDYFDYAVACASEIARELSPSGRKTLFTVNEKCFAYRSLDTGDDSHIVAVIPPENAFKQFIITTEGEE
jgi:hypothetical protein